MKILVISLAGVGDTLCATPLIRELALQYPSALIDVLVMWKASADLLRHNPDVNKIHYFNFLSATLNDSIAFLSYLRSEKYFLSFNSFPQSKVQYRMIARFIGADHRVSHRYSSSLLDVCLVNHIAEIDYTKHIIDNNLALLPDGPSGYKPKYELHLCKQDYAVANASWNRDYQYGNRKPILGVHVGSGGTKNLALRRWPAKNYRALFERLHDKFNILQFGDSSERIDDYNYFPSTNITEAAAMLGYCDKFLSVDTVFMHLAAAMEVPKQIVIETPTFNETVFPFNRDFVLVPNPDCHGRTLYRYDGKGIKGTDEEIRAMMQSVTVDVVEAAICQ